MKYSGIGYFISEGFGNIFKNKKSTMISIMTMVCTMLLFGIFYAIGANVDTLLDQVQRKQGMQVFIWDDATDEQRDELENDIKSLDGINTCTFKTKQEALDDFKEQLDGEDGQYLLDGYEGENNVFPASFVVTLTDLSKSEEIEDAITDFGIKIKNEKTNENTEVANTESTEETETSEEETQEVDLEVEGSTEHDSIIKRITSNDKTISTLITIVRGIRITIAVIFIFLLVISITIISNTIRLTVHARRKEISIMKYVGATNGFIRGPFVIEGIIIGLIAAILTLLLVGVVYNVVISNIETSNVLQRIGVTLLDFYEIAKPVALIYLLLGIGVGVVGSSISMKKYLEV